MTKKMKNRILLPVYVLSMLLILPCFALADLKADFVSFDRAFIPPLALTNVEKLKPSKKAMTLLNKNWAVFNAKYADAKPEDPKWKKDFATVDKMIKEADDIVNSGKGLMAAHETLESIRITFLELRRRNNIDYYIDYLTDFHGHMETIYHAGRDHTVEDMNDSDIYDLKGVLEEAMESWHKVASAPFDAALFGFGPEKVKKRNQLIELETEALNKLRQALEKKNKEMTIKTAKGVKPNYAQLYKLFGDFDSIMGKKA